MQKRNTPNPFYKSKQVTQSRCTSAVMFDKVQASQYHYSKQSYSSNEIDSFCKNFAKIIRNLNPDFEISYQVNSLSGILELLPSAIEEICEYYTREITEKCSGREESFKRTSKNLVKYEELLKEKELEFEEDRKSWESLRANELNSIQIQKDELIRAKVLIEQEFGKAAAELKEKEDQIEKQLNEFEVIRLEVHQNKIKNQELEWKLQQTLREVEEREEILKMKEEMILKDKEEIITEKFNVENEKMVNQVLNYELIKGNLEANNHKRCSSVAFNLDINKSFYSESPSKDIPFSRSENKIEESNFVISKQSFINIVNTKNALKVTANEVEELRDKILPEMHQQSEELAFLFDELKELRDTLKFTLGEIHEKSDELNKKFLEVEELFNENKKKEIELEENNKIAQDMKIRLQSHIDELASEKQKFEEECNDFHQEKLEFYEDVSNERQRIQDYYLGIEEKVHMLEMKRLELEKVNESLKNRDLGLILKKEHTRTNSTFN